METTTPDSGSGIGRLTRAVVALVLVVLIGAYTYAVLTGRIAEPHRIDATHLVAIVLTLTLAAILVSPGFTERIKTFELQGFKLELEKVRERQRRQEVELEDIRLLIPLLLPDPERKHLIGLAEGNAEVEGSDRRRNELRKLTSLGLLRRKPGRNIGDLRDGQTMALSELLEVTLLGQQWVRRLAELEARKSAQSEE
jgi:hypothetical protein